MPVSLEQAIEIAVNRSQEVRLAQSQVRRAEAQVGTARSEAFPQLDARVGYTRTFASPFSGGGGFTLPDSLRFEPDTTPSDDRWEAARGAERLWVVGDQRRLELDRLSWLVEGWGGRPATHREVARWDAGPDEGVVVVLLEPL